MRRLLPLPVLLAALAVLAGCGVPTGTGARAIPKDQVPFGLLAPHPPSTTTTTAPTSSVQVPVTVYFVDATQQHMTPALRSVPPTTTVTTELVSVLHALLAGPTAVEIEQGTQTAITAGVRLLDASVAGKLATVDFSQAFGDISGAQEVLAVAQVVYTVTDKLGTGVAVQFEIGGVPVQVPSATGAQQQGPVVLLDYYPALAPAPGSTTTSTTPTVGAATAANVAGVSATAARGRTG